MDRRGVVALAALISAAFLGYFFAWPLAAILGRGLLPHGQPHFGSVVDVAREPRLRGIVWFTFWQAGVSTLLTLLVGLPSAYVLYRLRFRGASALRALTIVPFVLPTVVAAAAFAALLGARGPLGRLHLIPGVAAIVLAHMFFNVAVVIRLVGVQWASIDRRIEEAARVLGATPTRVFHEVTLPALAPVIVAAGTIVFLFCFTSFGVILILGGLARNTVETEIYRLTTQQLALDRAGALVLVQLLTIGLVVTLTARFAREARRPPTTTSAVESTRPIRGVRERVGVGVVLAMLGALIGLPIATLVWRSTTSNFAGYRRLTAPSPVLGMSPTDALSNSLRDAAIATFLAVFIGGLAAVAIAARTKPSRSIDALILLPLGVSAVTIGFGFLIALDRPVDLRAVWWLIPVAHATIAIPFVVRSVAPVIRAIDPHLRDAATMLGASPGAVWRAVDLPIVRRVLLVAAGFAAAISFGEFGATAFIARDDAQTVPLAITRLLARPGSANAHLADALSVTLVLTTALVVLAVERLRVPGTADL